MKVALFLCPYWNSAFPTYALAGLSAQLRKAGHEPGIFDVNQAVRLTNSCRVGAEARAGDLGHDWHQDAFIEEQLECFGPYLESLVEQVLSDGYRVLGFQLYASNVKISLHLARLFKRRDPGVIVVFGGSECLQYDRCLHYARQEGVDAVVYGEGDLAFPRLIDEIARSGRPRSAPGVLAGDEASWKDEQEPVLELDELAYADYSGHRLSLYSGGKSLHTCRGCVRKCVFCSEWQVRKYRQMSGRRVFDEIVHQLKLDPEITSFLFADSLMNGSMRHLESLCDLIVDAGVKIRWQGYSIVRDDMSPAVFDKMARAGCTEIFFGLESGSPRILKEVGKGVSVELNARVLRDAVRAGLKVEAGWLVGFPTETEADFQESLDFIAANGRNIGKLSPNFFIISELMCESDKYNLAPPGHPVFWRTHDGANTFPVRMDRFRRFVKTALDHGAGLCWEGREPAEFEERFESMLETYRRWEAAGPH